MTAPLTSAKTMIWNALASFAIWRIGTNAMSTNMTAPVSVIACTGVPHLSWISVRDGGASWSRAIAKGYRDDDRIPALAVLISARTAAIMMAITPNRPSVASAAWIIGTAESLNRSGGVTPTMTTTMRT